jgi:hypothetical protein
VDKSPATDRNGFSRPLPQPIVLTPAEAKQVAGGIGAAARGSTSREHSEPTFTLSSRGDMPMELRELTNSETALVGGGMTDPPIIWPYPKLHNLSVGYDLTTMKTV